MKKLLIVLPLIVLMASCQKDWDDQNVRVEKDYAVLKPGDTFQIKVLSEGDATFSAWENESLSATSVCDAGTVTAKPAAEVLAKDTDNIKVSIPGLRDKNVVIVVDPAAE